MKRSRAKISATSTVPRVAVFRSNKGISAQLISDEKGHTITRASNAELSAADRKKPKSEQARLVGELLAKRAKDAGVRRAVFDRREYRYHGRVRALAEGAREGGLTL